MVRAGGLCYKQWLDLKVIVCKAHSQGCSNQPGFLGYWIGTVGCSARQIQALAHQALFPLAHRAWVSLAPLVLQPPNLLENQVHQRPLPAHITPQHALVASPNMESAARRQKVFASVASTRSTPPLPKMWLTTSLLMHTTRHWPSLFMPQNTSHLQGSLIGRTSVRTCKPGAQRGRKVVKSAQLPKSSDTTKIPGNSDALILGIALFLRCNMPGLHTNCTKAI